MANNQWYEGNEPDLNKYELAGEVDGFFVWYRKSSENKWINIKLTSINKRLAKANFWIAYNRDSEKFARGRDFFNLISNTNIITNIEKFILTH